MAGARTALALAAAACGVSALGLSLEGPRCGQLFCTRTQFCSVDLGQCENCIEICDKTHHNFDSILCEKECQDYIHDLRYISKPLSSLSPKVDDYWMNESVRQLELQMRAAWIIIGILLAIIVIYMFFKCWAFTKKNNDKLSWKFLCSHLQFSKNRVKQYPTDLTHQNPIHIEPPKNLMPAKGDLKLEIRSGATAETATNDITQKQITEQPLNIRDLPSEINVNNSIERSQTDGHTPKTVSTALSHRYPAEDATLDYSYDNLGMNLTPSPGAAAETKPKF